MFPVQFCTQSTTATSSLYFTNLSFTWINRTSKFMLIWRRNRHKNVTVNSSALFSISNFNLSEIYPAKAKNYFVNLKFKVITSCTGLVYLLFLVVEDKDNGCGEEN